jgi:carbonic anhydrase/acetyltransferase-like protein (isoleucine patch superfamily)
MTHTDGTTTVGSYVSVSGGWLGTLSNHPLHFFINGGEPRMTVDTTGNIGIGTITPNSKLAVAGLIESTTGGIKFPDGSIQTTAGGGGGGGILNQTTLQAGANFNIDGVGRVNILDASTQYNLGGSRILGGSDSGGNVFAGFNVGTVNQRYNNSFFGNNTGASNSFGGSNSFFGYNAGTSNTNGSYNTFIGVGSGLTNANGGDNTFVGAGAGQQNIVGQGNSFFGTGAGLKNISDFNSFFGRGAGANTSSGSLNVFAGLEAGIGNTTGSNNVFVGTRTGEFDTTGGNNTFIGGEAGRANSNGSNNVFVGYNAQGNIGNNLTNATAIGSNAAVLQSNSLVLGSINGVNSATADTKVGIGTTAPKATLDVTGGNIFVGTPGQGIILKSPDGGTCRLLSIDNAGNLVTAMTPCL